MHAKSTGELISVGFSDRSVEVWSQRITESRRKNDFTFWLIFGLSSNLEVSESLCKRLIQKVKSPKCCEVSSACELSRQNFVSRYYRNESNREIRHVRYLPRQQWSLLNCFSRGTGTLQCLHKEMATYRYWSVSLWWHPDDVSHCRILSPDKTEWRLISATICGWRRCFVADQLWLIKCIREEEVTSNPDFKVAILFNVK